MLQVRDSRLLVQELVPHFLDLDVLDLALVYELFNPSADLLLVALVIEYSDHLRAVLFLKRVESQFLLRAILLEPFDKLLFLL